MAMHAREGRNYLVDRHLTRLEKAQLYCANNKTLSKPVLPNGQEKLNLR